MTLRQLRYFIAIVDGGSLSKAAAHLLIAQPSLSQQLLALEAELGVPLLTRTPQGVQTTAAGERLYRHARTILRQVEQAKCDMTGDEAVTGTVSLGLPTCVSNILALPLLVELRRRYPGVHLQLFESLSGYLEELTNRHRLDLSILYTDAPIKGISVEPLISEDLFLVTPRDEESADATTVAMSAVAGLPLVLPSQSHTLRMLIERSFAPLGVPLRVIADVDSLPTMRRAAAAGVAATILPMSALGGEYDLQQVSVRRLTDPGIRRPISLCYAEGLPHTVASAAAVAVLREQVHALLASGRWQGARAWAAAAKSTE